MFTQKDFRRPGESAAFRACWELPDADARSLVGRLILACRRRVEEVPRLDQVVHGTHAVPLTRDEEKEVAAMLVASAQVPVLQSFGGPALAETSPFPVAPPLPETATGGTLPVTTEGTLPATQPHESRILSLGKSLWRGLPSPRVFSTEFSAALSARTTTSSVIFCGPFSLCCCSGRQGPGYWQ